MELRAKEYETMDALRRGIVERDLEIERLKKLKDKLLCKDCRFCVISPEGLFRRCPKRGMAVVSPEDYCSDGRPKDGKKQA